MEVEEKEPLIKRKDFRYLSQPKEDASVVQCCCVESTRLGRVPVIRTLFKKKDPKDKGTFSSSFSVLISMLGSVVGTGNIWRFPRIVANNAGNGGALVFLMIWFMFLWLWSMPIIIIEYGVGRFTKKTTVESFAKLIGPSYRFMGAFQAFMAICIGSYYSVLVGWCGYYFIHTCANPLPVNLNASNNTWNELQASNWPIAFHAAAIFGSGFSVLGGVSTIEPINKVIVPILLVIILFSFYWALFLPWASEGIVYMFSPNWASLKSSQVWLDGISQNAWDAGGGSGSVLTYAAYMKRSQGAVKLGCITPLLNNLVSLLCGILVFATVFSVQRSQGATTEMIQDTLQYNGPANTGLTFIWMPLLYGNISGGKVLAALFFLCITFAGWSSLISIIERPVRALEDFGIRRVPGTIMVTMTMFLVGTASALDSKVLANQDSTWAYALILCGCFMLYLVIRYGPLKFRRKFFTQYGIGDWPLPIVWVFVVVFVAPFEGVGLIIWWIVEQIINNPDTWWQITVDSLATVLTEWVVVLLVFIGLNWWLSPLVVYKPNDKRTRQILGLFFRLSPKFMLTDPPTPPLIRTPELIDSGSEDQFSMSATKFNENRKASTIKKPLLIKDIEL